MSLQDTDKMAKTSVSELVELLCDFSGPEWVTKFVLELHRFYMAREDTVPFSCDQGACFPNRRLIKIRVSILPLVERLNRTTRHWTPTHQEKLEVHDKYRKWVLEGHVHPFSRQSPADVPRPHRLTRTFILSRTSPFEQTFWRTKEGWQLELDGSEGLEHQLLRHKRVHQAVDMADTDDEQFPDQRPYRKELFGRNFRSTNWGSWIHDWISLPDPSQCGFGEPWASPLLAPEDAREVERESNGSSDRPSKFKDRSPYEGACTPPPSDVLDPSDSYSNPDPDMVAQSQDNGSPVEEPKWTAGPCQNPDPLHPLVLSTSELALDVKGKGRCLDA